jgi:hypothetical protein
VVVPAYIPNQEGYFKDSFTTKLCLETFIQLFITNFVTHNNGSGEKLVSDYLDLLFEGKIKYRNLYTRRI